MEILREWLVSYSLPLWAAHGVDRQQGGFFEKLSRSLIPSNDHRRARLVARQMYFFATGATLGWKGPSKSLVNHGYSYLLSHLVTPEGKVRATCTPEGEVIDARQHLYDVAFVLSALAKAVIHTDNDPGAEEVARRVVNNLSLHYSNPRGGYFDEVTPGEQCANPHMHLFEAFLAWAVLKRPDQGFWMERAQECAELALSTMIIDASGSIPEFFDANWNPLTKNGILPIEPGHQFEWSWLLALWSDLTGSTEAASAAEHLCLMAETYGVDHNRNAVFQCIDQFMKPVDLTSRLWQQTERLKAWHAQSLASGSAISHQNREKASLGLNQFLTGLTPGLWFDTMDASGTFVDEYVKASSGYHLACAAETISCADF